MEEKGGDVDAQWSGLKNRVWPWSKSTSAEKAAREVQGRRGLTSLRRSMADRSISNLKLPDPLLANLTPPKICVIYLTCLTKLEVIYYAYSK
jgi:hypothetical protein